MKRFLVLILTIYMFFNVYSQNYTRDVEVQFRKGIEVSYRHFMGDNVAYEGYFGYSQQEVRLTVLKEFFQPAFYRHTTNLDFCYGLLIPLHPY